MDNMQPYDVAIIGAGTAGLMAAWEIAQTGKNVVLLEARDRPGGRIHTINDARFCMPVELGAEFVHGQLQLTQLLLQKAGVSAYKISGSLWRKKGQELEKEKDFIEGYRYIRESLNSLEHDMPVADFLDRYLGAPEDREISGSLKTYVEGYCAADTNRASTFTLRDELEKGDDTQYRIEGGYIRLVQFLISELSKGNTTLRLSHPVSMVTWEPGAVQLHTPSGTVQSLKLLVTVPLGVLQTGRLRFLPDLPDKLSAARALGFGPVIKIILQFKDLFWEKKEYAFQNDLTGMAFLFSEEEVPTWWTQHPKKAPILVGWLAGPYAERFITLTEEDILQQSLASLSRIFSVDTPVLHKSLKAWKVTNWASDPYCCGGYSYEVVGGTEKKQILKSSVERTLYFAGEALYEGPEIGTVEAALVMGREAAHQIIAGI